MREAFEGGWGSGVQGFGLPVGKLPKVRPGGWGSYMRAVTRELGAFFVTTVSGIPEVRIPSKAIKSCHGGNRTHSGTVESSRFTLSAAKAKGFAKMHAPAPGNPETLDCRELFSSVLIICFSR